MNIRKKNGKKKGAIPKTNEIELRLQDSKKKEHQELRNILEEIINESKKKNKVLAISYLKFFLKQ